MGVCLTDNMHGDKLLNTLLHRHSKTVPRMTINPSEKGSRYVQLVLYLPEEVILNVIDGLVITYDEI